MGSAPWHHLGIQASGMLSYFRLLSQNIIHGVAYKTKTCFLQSWRPEVLGQSISMVGFWWEVSYRLQTSILLYLHMVVREQESSLGPLCKGTNLIHKGSTHSWSNYFLKSPPPNTMTWGLRFQRINLGRQKDLVHHTITGSNHSRFQSVT